MRKKLPTKIKLHVNIPTSGCLTNIVEEIMHKKNGEIFVTPLSNMSEIYKAKNT